MPSPFPGMDPYLENPEIFPDFHDTFITMVKLAVQPILPDPYFAAIGSRVWLEVVDRYFGPDIHIRRHGNGKKQKSDAPGSIALVEPRAKPIVVNVPQEEIIEKFVNIFKQSKGLKKRLVTSIELLSPTNKKPGAHGRDEFMSKQNKLYETGVNLVELDLLRGGDHATAVPLEWAKVEAGRFDYHVCCRRAEDDEDFLVYPIMLASPLPPIAIPLLPADGEVEIDLQEVFSRTYAGGSYDRLIDYANEKVKPPLSPSQAIWLKKSLAEKGIISRERSKK